LTVGLSVKIFQTILSGCFFVPLSFQKHIVDKEAFHSGRSAWVSFPDNISPD